MNRLDLADTGPLYALADPSDQYHLRAQTELHRIDAVVATMSERLRSAVWTCDRDFESMGIKRWG